VTTYIPFDTVARDIVRRFVSTSSTAKEMIFALTGRVESEWEWGLQCKLDAGLCRDPAQFEKDVRWILTETIRSNRMNPAVEFRITQLLGLYQTPLPPMRVNIDYIDQFDMDGLHRSGWGYVVSSIHKSGMTTLHPEAIYCDLYVDRTFHWNYKANKMAGIAVVPYQRPWIGFIHHTTHTSYTPYHVGALFQNADFMESLKWCRGLIVMTQSMRVRLEKLLATLHATPIQVHVLYHPTEMLSKERCFSMKRFTANPQRRIIQVGAWYRDISAIFRLDLYANPLGYTKTALVGKKMEGYYAKYMATGNIAMMPMVENEEYDRLLSENILFIKLVDASAVNTVIEAIVRNTPLLINRIAPVVEYLGGDYPFYYETLDEASRKASSFDHVQKAYHYLKHMDKKNLRMETFLESLRNVIQNVK